MNLTTQGIKRWWPLAPIWALLVGHALYFNFLTDDAYISFVYSRNFAEHNQLVFNLGEYVEGYTNFLWTLVLGVLMKLGIGPEWSSRVLGTGFAAGTLVLVVRLSATIRGATSRWDLLPALLLAISSGFSCWCMGGLETHMFTFFVTLGLLSYLRGSLGGTAVALALAALTRPEGAVVFAVVVLHRLVANVVRERRIWPSRAEWLGVLAFALIYVPYFAWRWWYYGWPFPNTYYVKAGLDAVPHYRARVWSYGGFYVWQWAVQSGALFAVPLALIAALRRRLFGSLAWLLIAVYLVYTAKMGGDFMGLHRFVMPLFVLAALLTAVGLADLIARLNRPTGKRIAQVACAMLIAGFAVSQAFLSERSLEPRADHGIDRPGYLKLYTHDRMRMGMALQPHLQPDDYAILGGAGVQTYYARMRGVDVFGLVSEQIAHEVKPGNPRPGHQKWAPAGFLLKLRPRPTLLLHCYDLHRDPQRYKLCGEAGYFKARGYEPVTLYVPGLKERGEYYTFLKDRRRIWP